MAKDGMKICYVVTKSKEGKSFWNRIGVAFVNSDGSLSVKLDSLPINGEMQIRDYVPREGGASGGGGRDSGEPRPVVRDPLGDDDVPF